MKKTGISFWAYSEKHEATGWHLIMKTLSTLSSWVPLIAYGASRDTSLLKTLTKLYNASANPCLFLRMTYEIALTISLKDEPLLLTC